MLTSVEDLLGRMPVFAGLSDEARGALAERLTRRPERRSSVIFEEGEPGDRVFLILAGKMKISRRSTDGRENLLAVLGPGDIFGELSLFDPGPRTATATALTDVELASLEHSSLKPWLTDRPEAAELLLRVLARRLRRTNEAMGDLVFTDVPGRVAKQLLDLAERFGVPGSNGSVRVEHGLTQEELAQLVGASRETVNKSLADFATRGWLRLDSRAVILLDRERLARRAR
jgi:CRP/FNR family transcriptional regulator, cyclic AMP receptor protein